MSTQDLTESAFARLVIMLEGFGNSLNDAHEIALHALVESMTDMAQGKLQGRYTFGLPTGMGKTRAIIAWVSALHALGMDRQYSLAVSASKVEALCQLKRDLVSEGVPAEKIGLLHSYRHNPSLPVGPVMVEGFASEPSTEANDERPILLVTHNRIRAGNLKQFNLYQGQPRNLLLWDESLIVSDSSYILSHLLEGSIGFLERAYKDEEGYGDLIHYLNACSAVVARVLTCLKKEGSKTVEAITTLPACPPHQLAQFKAVLAERLSPNDAIKTLLDLVPYPLRVVWTGQGGLVSYRISVPNAIKNVLVLDASQPIRKLVHLDGSIQDAERCLPSVRRLGMPLAQLKRFDDVTLHQLHSGGGRSTLQKDFAQKYRQDRKISGEIVEVVNNIPKGEGVLIFTYKSLTSGGPHYRNTLLRDMADAGIDITTTLSNGKQRVNVVTWGMETSLNDYAFCAHVILAGVLQRDGVDIAGSYLGQRDNLKADISRKIVQDLLLSEVVHVIYQALSRGACRVVKNGYASKMTGYIIHRDDAIREELEKVMPGVGWKTWNAKRITVKPGEIKARANEVSNFLDRISPSTPHISCRQLKQQLNLKHIPTQTFNRVVNKALEVNRNWIRSAQSLIQGYSVFEKSSS